MDPPPQPSVDRLSSLPEHLQDEILSRLDLRDAVRASALSRAWSRRWEILPGLAVSFPDGTPAWVIYSVLLRYAGPSISKFACHVDGRAPAIASHVGDWIVALSRRRVESISILNDGGGGGEILPLHSSIFSCHRLVSLTLERCTIPPLPESIIFPVLEELHLTSVEFADNGESQLSAIIRASPLLRALLLDDVYVADDADWVTSPNLHAVGVIPYDDFDWRFGDLPCLRYASISLPDYHPGGAAQVLAAVSHVQELVFRSPRCYLKRDAVLPFTFYNLKSMELLTDLSDVDNV